MRPSPHPLSVFVAALIVALIALPATASAPSATDQSIRRTTMPPALDGALTEWSGVAPMVLDLDTRAPNSSGPVDRSDAMYTLQMLQTADALYLGFHARDEKIVADSGLDLHRDDSLRFSVDGNKDGLGGSPSDHAFRIRADGAYDDGGNAITSLTVVAAAVPGGWNLEVKIPAAVLALPLASSSFKFNWAAGDDDNGSGLDTFYLYAGSQADTPEPSWPTATLDGEAFTPVGLLEAGRWEWYGGGSLGAVYAGTGVNVWAGGNGVWKTTNNVSNWNRFPLLANAEITGLRFWDANRGLALAANKVYLTEDGGVTWRLSYDAGQKSLRQLSAGGSDTAWLVEREVFGYLGPEHERILKTRDGGATWQVALDPAAETVYAQDTAAYGADRFWALVVPGDGGGRHLAVTVNGGASWAALPLADSGGEIVAQRIAFADPLVGWLAGSQSGGNYIRLWRTADGGQTWQKQGLGVESVDWLTSYDSKTAWLASGDQLFRTTDGANWYKISDDAPARASFRSATEGWGIEGRAIRRTTNGGATWSTVYTPPDAPLVRWWDHLRGWRISGATVERTVDGGGTWSAANTGLLAVEHLQMVTPLVGWAWHDSSVALRKTTDGGATWKTQNPGSDALRDLQFVSTTHGWVRDTANNLRRTIDGGATWQLVAAPPDPDGSGSPGVYLDRALYFVNPNLGIAGVRRTTAADDCANFFSRTTDGGVTWSTLLPGPSGVFAFGTSQIGWGIAGCETRYMPAPVESFSKTTNGGAAWSELASDTMLTTDMHAQDAEQLFRFPTGGPAGKSSDGGATFARQRAETADLSLRSRPDRVYHEEPGSGAARMIYRNTEIPAYRATVAPRIDGNLDEWGQAWQTSLKASNAAATNGGAPAALQSSAVLRAVWDANNLYIAAQVYDDEIRVDSPDKPWHDDGVEIAIDPAHDHLNQAPDSDRQYLLTADGAQHLWGGATTGLEVGRQETANGYILEVRIPRSLIPSLALKTGSVAGFNFSVIDDIDGGNAETRLFWTGTLTSHPEANWGQIRFSAIDAGIQPGGDPSTPTPTPTVTPTATPTTGPDNGTLGGTAWHDINGNRQMEQGEPFLVGVTIRLYRGGLQIGQTVTDGAGKYAFAHLVPGDYRVEEQQPAWLPFSSTPSSVNVTVGSTAVTVNFGDWFGLSGYLPVILK